MWPRMLKTFIIPVGVKNELFELFEFQNYRISAFLRELFVLEWVKAATFSWKSRQHRRLQSNSKEMMKIFYSLNYLKKFFRNFSFSSLKSIKIVRKCTFRGKDPFSRSRFVNRKAVSNSQLWKFGRSTSSSFGRKFDASSFRKNEIWRKSV